MEKQTHPVEVATIYEEILNESSAEGRFVDIGAGHKIHVIEAGTGPPLVMLHGTGAAAHTLLPLFEYLKRVHILAPDLPGNGLSDPLDPGRRSYREMAVQVTGRMLDALGMDHVSLAGSSGGGVWATWYALAFPERVQRLILLGSAPLLPGTKALLPLRLMTTPIIGDIMARIPASERTIVQLLGLVGEKETIVKYPKMIRALAAGNNDPVAARASRTEFAAFLNLRGFRPHMKIQVDELAALNMPTLIIWGDHDPVGEVDVARAVQKAIPDSELAVLPAGHVPWLGNPDKVGTLISDFLLSD